MMAHGQHGPSTLLTGGSAGFDAGLNQAATVYETYKALPALSHPYTDFDLALVSEIITLAEEQTREAARKGRGTGEITLQKLLKAYEAVLPKHGVKPDDDIHYYRLLLKLSLDPDPDWWAKFRREVHSVASGIKRSPSPPRAPVSPPRRATPPRYSSPIRQSRPLASTIPPATTSYRVSATDIAPAARTTSHSAHQSSVRTTGHDGFQPGPAISDIYAGSSARLGGASMVQSFNDNHSNGLPYGRTTAQEGHQSGLNAAEPHARRRVGPGNNSLAQTANIPPLPPSDATTQAARGAGPYGADVGAPHGASGSYPETAVSTDILPGGHGWPDNTFMSAPGAAGLYPDGRIRPGNSEGVADTGAPQQVYGAHGLPPDSRFLHGNSGVAGAGSTQPAYVPHGLPPDGRIPPNNGRGGTNTAANQLAYGSHGLPSDGRTGSGGVHEPSGMQYAVLPNTWQGVPGSISLPVGPHPTAMPSQPTAYATGQPSPGTTYPGAFLSSMYGDPVAPNMAAASPAMSSGYGSLGGTPMAAGRVSLMDAASYEDGEEGAEALAEFKALASSFRDWRTNAAVARDARAAREAAVENWGIAVSFWEVHLVQRCFTRWARYRGEMLGRAIELWTSASVAAYFKRWLEITRHLRVASHLSEEHSTQTAKRKALRAWRQYVVIARADSDAAFKAMSFWTGRSLQAYFLAWKQFTQKAIEDGNQADAFYAYHARHTLMIMWSRAAKRAKRQRLTEESIRARIEARLKFAATALWHEAWLGNKQRARLLSGAVTRLTNLMLARAFNKLRQNVEDAHNERDAMAKAGRFLLSSALGKAWNSWRAYIDNVHDKKDAATRALKLWTNRSLSSAWASWRLLVEWRKENEHVAREHAIRSLAYLQAEAWEGWRSWHAQRMVKAEVLGVAVGRMDAFKLARLLGAWHDLIITRRLDLQAFNEIMTIEVARLKTTAWRRMWREWGNVKRAHHIGEALQVAAATRALRSWRVVAHTKKQRRAQRDAALTHASDRRKFKLLTAWRAVAAVCVEQARKVSYAHMKAARKQQQAVLRALKVGVLYSAAKKLKALTAVAHWERRKKAVAMRGWRARYLHWRGKAAAWDRASMHHRTRLMDTAFVSWLGSWQGYQSKLSKALVHLTNTNSVRQLLVIREWRKVAAMSSVKHEKVRRALAHWIGGTLWRCFHAWHGNTMARLELMNRAHAAITHWVKGAMARAFQRWKDWALHKVELNTRANAYLAVLTGRTTAYAFLMLRANASRKRRSREARKVWAFNTKRRVFQRLQLRLLMVGSLEENLQRVFAKMMGATLQMAFTGWRNVVEDGHRARQAAFKALYYWMNSRLRVGFDALRCHALRKAMERALVLKYNLKLVSEVMRVWWAETLRSLDLRRRMLHMLHKTTKQTLREAMACWKEWIQLKRSGEFANNKALAYLANHLLGRAWNSWKEHHMFCHKAKRALHHMMSRQLAAAFNTWWSQVLRSRIVWGTATQFLMRVQNRELAAGIDAFKHNVVWQMKKRTADQHFFMCKGRQVLTGWHYAVKLGMAMDLWTSNRLRLAFSQWAQVVGRKRHLRITADTVARRWRNSQLSAAWQAWRGYTEMARGWREGVLRALGFWVNKLLASSWLAWRDYIMWKDGMRCKALMVVAKVRNRHLLSAWNGWKEFMYLHEVKQRAIMTWKLKSLAAAFRTWRDAALHRAEAVRTAEELFAHITTRFVSETLSGVFTAWRRLAHRMCQLRMILQTVLGRHMQMAFYGWRDVAADLKYRKAMQAMIEGVVAERQGMGVTARAAVVRWRNWDQSLPFYSWLWAVQGHKHALQAAATAVFAYAGCLARKTLMGWHKVVSMSLRMKAIAQHVILRMGGLKLSRAFYFWLALARYLSHMKAAMSAIQARVALRNKHYAWASWRYCVEYARIGRKAIVRLAMRTQFEAFRQWHEWAVKSRENKAKVRQVLGRIMNRVLSGAFAAWRGFVLRAARLRISSAQVVARMAHSTLWQSWSAWRSYVEDKAKLADKIEAVVFRFTHKQLSAAFNKWLEYHRECEAETRADVHYYGHLLDSAWLAWLQFVDDVVIMRGLEANRLVVFRRAMDCWLLAVREGRTSRALTAALDAACVLRGLRAWQHQLRARMALIRLYQRRAFVGWYSHVLHLQQQRFKLQSAVQLLMYGSLARTFRAWLSHTRDMVLKRMVFVQKQHAIQEALRIGDQIRARRNTEMLGATFGAWRFQVGMYRKVAARFAAVMKRGLASAFYEWRGLVASMRAANNRATHHFRSSWMSKYFFAWFKTAKAMHEVTLEHEALCEDFWYGSTASKALRSWKAGVDLVVAQRSSLLRIFETQWKEEAQALLQLAWRSWRQAMRLRQELLYAVDMASSSRRQRILSSVFNVWLQYVSAMQGEVDEGSPFASPRTKHENRRLVRRMAAMVGNTEVDAGSDASSDVFQGLYKSPQLLEAREVAANRAAYLRLGGGGTVQHTAAAVLRGASTVADDDDLDRWGGSVDGGLISAGLSRVSSMARSMHASQAAGHAVAAAAPIPAFVGFRGAADPSTAFMTPGGPYMGPSPVPWKGSLLNAAITATPTIRGGSRPGSSVGASVAMARGGGVVTGGAGSSSILERAMQRGAPVLIGYSGVGLAAITPRAPPSPSLKSARTSSSGSSTDY